MNTDASVSNATTPSLKRKYTSLETPRSHVHKKMLTSAPDEVFDHHEDGDEDDGEECECSNHFLTTCCQDILTKTQSHHDLVYSLREFHEDKPDLVDKLIRTCYKTYKTDIDQAMINLRKALFECCGYIEIRTPECSICLEPYQDKCGRLNKCKHAACITCIKKLETQENGVSKFKCATCRVESTLYVEVLF